MTGRQLKTGVYAAVALAAGLALRLWFVGHAARISGDTLLYGNVARNWMQHGVYAFTPALLMVIPSCFVETVALTWATTLQILGLSKAHRISYGVASVGVIGFHLLASTCICIAGAVAWSMIMGGHGLS